MPQSSIPERQFDPQQEADIIFSLLAYSLAYRDWQSSTLPRDRRRGYNIAAVLVSPDLRPVFAGLNCIDSTNNATQHAEFRCVTGFLEMEERFNLAGFTLYVTLEPCIMCAGIMTMVSLKRLVFGQHDVLYSNAFPRLSIDSRSIGGFAPYPRQVVSEAIELPYRKQLDAAYSLFLEKDPEKILAKFLSSGDAETIFKNASTEFFNYVPRHAENEIIYKKARDFSWPT